jgi:hypothetical protein
MTDKAPVFPIRLDLKQPFPETVDCGAPFTFTIAVETDSGCDLAGAPYRITDEAGQTVGSGQLPTIVRITPESDAYDPRHGPVDLRASAEVTVTAPAQIGSFAWTVTLPDCVIKDIRHSGACLAIEFTTKEHATSLAVWHSPTPVTVGAQFSFNVGAKCTAGCLLSGQVIEVVDTESAVVAQAVLSEARWHETRGLHWATVEAPAPAALGHYLWSVRMAAPEHGLPHGKPNPASFSFVTMNPPEYQVDIEIIEEETAAPVADAHVRLGPYRASTDQAGWVRFQLPGGEFGMRIWKENLQAPEQILQVDRNVVLKINAKVVPEKDPYAFYVRD